MLKIDVILDAGLPAPKVQRLGELADQYSIQTLWGSSFASRREPMLTMAGLATSTRRVRLGTLPVSPYEVHPLRIADSLLTFNELCDGRASILIGGLGHSTGRVTGLVPTDRVDRVRDCVSILKGISPARTLNYEGTHYRLTDYRPEWSVQPLPRVYVGATGPNMLRMAAGVADGTMMGDVPLTRMPDIKAWVSEGLRASGRRSSDFRVSNFFAWHIGSNRAASFADARRNLIWRGFLQDWHIATFLDNAECALVQSRRQAFLDAFLQQSDRIEGVPEGIVDALVDNLTFAGGLADIDRVITKLHAYRNAGLDEVALKIHGEPEEAIRLIGERIVPAFS